MAKKQKVNAPKNEIDEAVKGSVNFVEKHKNALIYGTIGALVVILAVILFVNSSKKKKEKTANAAALALTQAVEGPDSTKVANLEAVVDEYGNTSAGNQARILLAREHYDAGDYEAAKNVLEGYSYDGDAIVGPKAICMKGDCYAALGQLDKAVKAFEDAADKADNAIVSPEALMKATYAYMELGKKDDATRCLQTIKTKYPNSQEAAQLVDMLLENLK